MKAFTVTDYFLCLGVLVLTVVLGCSYGTHYEWCADMGEMVSHVQSWSLGKVPYRDLFYHHTIGFLVPFYLVDTIFGLSPSSVLALQVVFHLLCVALVSLVAVVLSGRRTAGRWAALLMSTVGWFPEWEGLLFEPQSIFLPLFCLYILLLAISMRSHSLPSWKLSCVTLGLLLLCDQRMVLFIPLSMFVWFLARHAHSPVKLARTGIAWGAAPLIAAAVLLLVLGAFDEAIFQTIIFPLYYRNAMLDTSPVARAWSFLLHYPGRSLPFIESMVVVGLMRALRRVKAFLLLAVVSAIAYALSGGRDFPHYNLLLSPLLVLVLSIFLAEGLRVPRIFSRRLGSSVLRVSMGLSCLIWFHLSLERHETKPSELRLKWIAREVEQFSRPEDPLFVWGYCLQISALSHRMPPQRDIGLLASVGKSLHAGGAAMVPSERRSLIDIFRFRPPLLVVMRLDNERIDGWEELPCIFAPIQAEARTNNSFVRETVLRNYELIRTFTCRKVKLGLFRFTGRL